MSDDRQRYIVWIPSPSGGEMTPARDARSEDAAPIAGLRAMHELAVAIAATGRRVQMRGRVDRAELRGLAETAGVGAPELAGESDRPGPGDVVIMPEGQEDPLVFARIALSRTRAEIEDLWTRLGEHDELCALLTDAEQRLARMAEVELQISALSRELDGARAAVNSAREEARELDERLMQSQRGYAAVINSRTWRLTKPLRMAKQRLTRMSQTLPRRDI